MQFKDFFILGLLTAISLKIAWILLILLKVGLIACLLILTGIIFALFF